MSVPPMAMLETRRVEGRGFPLLAILGNTKPEKNNNLKLEIFCKFCH
jgi:hypothetical protein